MALTRQQKEEQIARGQKVLSEAGSVVLMAYDSLTVEESEQLRTQLFAEGARMRIMPKRLLKLALSSRDISFDPQTQEGQMAVIWGDDAVTPSQVAFKFAKSRETARLVGGIMNGAFITGEQVLALAQLPGREQLIGQVVGTIAAPLRGYLSVLSGVQRNFVYALSAIKDQKA